MKERSSVARTKVLQANRQENPLEAISLDHNFENRSYVYECQHFHELPQFVQDWAFDLLSANMKRLYQTSSWGWHPREKMTELTASSAWCLLAKKEILDGSLSISSSETCGDKKPVVGFVHFRYDLDYGRPVLYCYEIHVEKDERGRGLGRRLLSILQLLARHAGMEKVMATVFKHNQASLQFFRRCGFKEDETNPNEDENKDYVILSLNVS